MTVEQCVANLERADVPCAPVRTPGEAVEDALAGVEAGRAGHFALVVGVDRVGQADGLRQHGADTVVRDLSELLDQDDPADKGTR